MVNDPLEDMRRAIEAAKRPAPAPVMAQLISHRTWVEVERDPTWREALQQLGPGWWPHGMVAAVVEHNRKRQL